MKNICSQVLGISTFFLIVSTGVSAQTTQDTTNARRQGGGFITGTSSVSRLPTMPEINCGVSKVSFQPGARTIWHSHAGGQIIVVTEGSGYYQEKGKPRQIIRQGEAVICPPNVQHWHGATPDSSMTHVVATPNLDKGGVTSFEQVTEQEYKGSN